jgi:hypothetical protein
MGEMRVVIQCAGSKKPNAGYFRDREGRPITFVARPDEAPATNGRVYARPDDLSDANGETWRQQLQAYNNASDNPFELCQAHRLYANRAYSDLTERFGAANIFILSAGWGLVRGEFRLPNYDITFSAAADRYKQRKNRDAYSDFCQLDVNDARPIAFLVGERYLQLLVQLARKFPDQFRGEKILFHVTAVAPEIPGWRAQRFPTRKSTNWQYDCAHALIKGDLDREI